MIEVKRILHAAGIDLNLVGLAELDIDVPEVAETGATFAQNALLKARAVADATGLPAIADDSGICVDALNGMPGVLSARWAGGHGDDAANLDLLLEQIVDVPSERRGAQFVAAVVYLCPGEDPLTVQGTVSGTLLFERRGDGGFGYDPIFVPAGYDQTSAELSPTQKDAISHRGNAMRALAALLVPS